MKVATERIVANIPNSLFLDCENKEGTPVETPTKFMKNWMTAIAPTTSSAAEAKAVIQTNRKNIAPKIETIKEVILKPE